MSLPWDSDPNAERKEQHEREQQTHLPDLRVQLGMAIGTSLLAGVLGNLGFVANQSQNIAVQSAIHHAFSTIPGVLWIVTAVVLFFYQINKNSYNRIIAELGAKKGAETCSTL